MPTTRSQLANGDGMATVASWMGVTPAFVMAVGDNFYECGVTDVESRRFASTFEAAFRQPALQVPWYAIAGNHDHRGNVSAQLAYAAQRRGTARWRYPHLWYTFTERAPSGATVQIVYIDTVVLAGMPQEEGEPGVVAEQYAPHPAQRLGPEQLAWLEATLASSTADYLWVSGHYPVFSPCQHGPTPALLRDVLPLLRRHGAAGFIAGHDHCSAHYEHHGMAFVLSGAGRECCYHPRHLASPLNPGPPHFRMDRERHYGAIGGFASFSVGAAATTLRYHSDNGARSSPAHTSTRLISHAALSRLGTVLYTAEPILPRRPEAGTES